MAIVRSLCAIAAASCVYTAACSFTPGTLPSGEPMQGDDAAVVDAGDLVDTLQVVVDAPPDAMPDAFVPPQPTWVVVETITVPVNGTSVMSTLVLGNGVGYRLRAEGQFNITATGTPGDAEYWDYVAMSPQDTVSGIDMGLAINDPVVDGTRTPDWGAYTATHVYEVAWTGNGQRLSAMIHDGNPSNNSGSLTLKILALQ